MIDNTSFKKYLVLAEELKRIMEFEGDSDISNSKSTITMYKKRERGVRI